VSKDGEQTPVRVALHEIERLVAEASMTHGGTDSWVGQLAAELRSAMPELEVEAASEIAARMLADPRKSLGAQARLNRAAIRTLRG
jgi:chemotaxis regulatin CheY-phosphate phosphatase CheZ